MDTTAIVGLAYQTALAGIQADSIEPIRIRDNWMLRIPACATVIRIHPPGRSDIAVRELRAADWLRSHKVPAAEPLVPDPVTVADRPSPSGTTWGPTAPPNPRPPPAHCCDCTTCAYPST